MRYCILFLFSCNFATQTKNNKFMGIVKLCKFEKAYIISQIDPYDVVGISPNYFTIKDVDKRLKELIELDEKNKEKYMFFLNKLTK